MHVRVCVECGEEYRPGIVTCADCGGALEDRHDDGHRSARPAAAPAESAESGGVPEADFTETIVRAEKATELTAPADRLVEAGVEFVLRPALPGGYQLLVAAADHDRALSALGLLAEEGASAPDACPACGFALQPGSVECPECGLGIGDEPE
jgi:hypothetical protein